MANRILTINGVPETFTSKLPRGVHGSLELLDEMTIENVDWCEVDNDDMYEGNIDGEWTVQFKNGDEIRFDGYYGDRKLAHAYSSLTDKAKEKALKCFKEMLGELIQDMNE